MKLLMGDAEAKKLGEAIRSDHSAAMHDRRAIASLAVAASLPLAVIALWQIGAVKRLPDPPLPLFDAEKVNGSGEAYQKLATGDAFLGIGSYFATATLAAMGAGDRGRLLALATGVKVMADAAISGKLTLDQWTRYRAFCFLCLVSAAATFAMVPFAVAEMRRALKA